MMISGHLLPKHQGFTEQFPRKSNSADSEPKNRAAGRPYQLAGFLPPQGMLLNALYLANYSAIGPHKPQILPSYLKAVKAFYLLSCNKTVTLKASSILNTVINFCWPNHPAQRYYLLQVLFPIHEVPKSSYSSKQKNHLVLAQKDCHVI